MLTRSVIPLLISVVLAFLASFALTPVMGRVARKFGLLDQPASADHKRHRLAVPYLGGVAIMAGFLLSTLFLSVAYGRSLNLGGPFLGIVAAVMLGLVGLADDIKPLPRTLRLGAQLLAAMAAWSAGFAVHVGGSHELDLAITLLWILAITNAFNLLDNMDGLSAGLAGVGALSFATLGALEGMGTLVVTSGALAGGAFGFLAHNRYPARNFMGDSGSLFLGYLLALIGIKLRFDNLVEVTFLVPVVVLGLPILDTTLVVVSRVRHRRPPFRGARDHISHRLATIGFPVRSAVGLLYWAGICLGWLGIVISRSNTQVGWMLLAFVLAMAIFFTVLLWDVPVYESSVPTRQRPFARSRKALEARPAPAITHPDRVTTVRGSLKETIEFVGPPGERLFSIRHEGTEPGNLGVVVCSSVHAELLKNYRKEVILGRSLAGRGVPVQRFHYLGAGNSDGPGAMTAFEQMLEDTQRAAENLRRNTGVERVMFVGTRLGALVAAAASRLEGDTPLVLWDPVLDRRSFFREIFRSAIITEVRGTDADPRTSTDLLEELTTTGSLNLLGYRIDISLYDSLEERTLMGEVGSQPRPLLLCQIVRGGEVRGPLLDIVTSWSEAGFDISSRAVDAEEAWWFSSKPWRPEEDLTGVKELVSTTTDWIQTLDLRVGQRS